MNLFGRKSAGRAPVRPALARGFPWAFSEIPRSYEAQVRAGYLENAVAQRAVRMVAEAVGGAPLSSSDPGLAALVAATSAGQSLLETLAAQLLLHGNGFIQILEGADGRPRELYALRPERVSVEGDARGWPVAFGYRANQVTTRLPADMVIHAKAMHPLDDHYGLGCLGAASGAIAIHNAATLWNKALLDNAARPSGALVYDAGEALSPDQFEQLRTELEASFSGAGNAGRPMLLEGGLKWQALSLTPAEMDFAGLKAAAAREIALAFGVPPVLLGLPGDATYANYREANRALWRQTVLPLAGKLLGAIAQGLARWYPQASLAVDLDRVTELSEERERLWAQVNAAGFLTLTEKRAAVGLEALGVAEPTEAAAVSAPLEREARAELETKFNPWHDPEDGRFTFAGTGSRSGGSSFAQGGGSDTIGRGTSPSGTRTGFEAAPSVAMAERPKAPVQAAGKRIVNKPTFTYQLGNLNGKGYTPSPDDAPLLARIIYAESLSNPEDFEAIGWATVNRVGERQHGMTLHQVIFKPGRFQSVSGNGSPLWRESADPSKLKGDKLKGWEHALAAASGIMNGMITDPTKGATYFIASDKYVSGKPETAPSDFFRSGIAKGTLSDSKYVSTSTRKTQNHFFIENPPLPRPKSTKK